MRSLGWRVSAIDFFFLCVCPPTQKPREKNDFHYVIVRGRIGENVILSSSHTRSGRERERLLHPRSRRRGACMPSSRRARSLLSCHAVLRGIASRRLSGGSMWTAWIVAVSRGESNVTKTNARHVVSLVSPVHPSDCGTLFFTNVF